MCPAFVFLTSAFFCDNLCLAMNEMQIIQQIKHLEKRIAGLERQRPVVWNSPLEKRLKDWKLSQTQEQRKTLLQTSGVLKGKLGNTLKLQRQVRGEWDKRLKKQIRLAKG